MIKPIVIPDKGLELFDRGEAICVVVAGLSPERDNLVKCVYGKKTCNARVVWSEICRGVQRVTIRKD